MILNEFHTACSIPAKARAVYAPLEKPKMQILSPPFQLDCRKRYPPQTWLDRSETRKLCPRASQVPTCSSRCNATPWSTALDNHVMPGVVNLVVEYVPMPV